MATKMNLGTGYTPVKRSVISGTAVSYGPTFASEDQARSWIERYERGNGCTTGIDHGFGCGSGYRVEVSP